jgi:hypothetical protein
MFDEHELPKRRKGPVAESDKDMVDHGCALAYHAHTGPKDSGSSPDEDSIKVAIMLRTPKYHQRSNQVHCNIQQTL